jgi:hypothetical protein
VRVEVNLCHTDIADGDRARCDSCPVALAVVGAVPGCTDVEVTGRWIAIARGDEHWQARTPAVVAEWMRTFDGHGPLFVQPISFPLDFEPADPTA